MRNISVSDRQWWRSNWKLQYLVFKCYKVKTEGIDHVSHVETLYVHGHMSMLLSVKVVQAIGGGGDPIESFDA